MGALLGIVVATQVATVAGAGAWFRLVPYAAPGLWPGMGGAAGAAEVSAGRLALAVPVGLLAVVATASWWSGAEV